MSDRKWRLAVWGMLLASLIISVALAGIFLQYETALAALAQGIGLVAAVFGLYAAANVTQKNVISKNYIPEKDK